jgi:hypothetical protein
VDPSLWKSGDGVCAPRASTRLRPRTAVPQRLPPDATYPQRTLPPSLSFNYPGDDVSVCAFRESERRRRSGTLQKKEEGERMMGFEPTTFCMASGSWIRSPGTLEPASLAGSSVRSRRTCAPLDSGHLRSIRWGLGTGSGFVPIRGGDRLIRNWRPK